MNIGSVFEFGFSQRYPSLFRHAHNKMTAALYPYLKSAKVILYGTIRNDHFLRNTALQCWNNVATILINVATMLQRCVALIIVVANRPL